MFNEKATDSSATNLANPPKEDVCSSSRQATANTQPPDPQVKPPRQHKSRRHYSSTYKARFMAAYDACKTPSERGALLRKEGLYRSRVYAWKKEQADEQKIIKKNKKEEKNTRNEKNNQRKSSIKKAIN